MNTTRYCVLLIFITIASIANAMSDIIWLETLHNFGTFDEDMGKVDCVMRFVNTGKEDVVIEQVRPTCGCTAGEYPRQPIAPGDTAKIRLIYNPYGRPGRFSKDVIVITNTEPRRTKLIITGNVIGTANTVRKQYPEGVGDMKFNKLIVPFGELEKGNLRTGMIKGYNQSRDSLRLTFDGLPPFVSVKTLPDVVAPGDIATITLFYDSAKQKDWGTLSDSLEVKVVNVATAQETTAHINVIATVIENIELLNKKGVKKAPVCELSTDKLDFGILQPDATRELSFTIRNIGKGILSIHKVYSIDKAITISPMSADVKKGKSVTFNIKVNTALIDDNMLNAKIMIITNDPAATLTSIRAVGEIKR